MLMIPALDIKSNNIIRLKKGDFNKISFYSNNPLFVLKNLIELKCKRIHLIDLDGALKGKPCNLFIVKLIRYFYENEIQLGGGLRDINIINYYFNFKLNYLILGTKVFNNLKFLNYISDNFPYKIILSLDLKDNKIVINGWNKLNLNLNFLKFLNKIKNFKLNSIIYTDVLKDGTLSGFNFKFLKNFNKFKFNLIISGGLKNINDYKICYNLKFLLGFICGKSIYINNFNYENIIKFNNQFNHYYIND